MGVSNGWKSHFGQLTLSFPKLQIYFVNTEAGVSRCYVKMVFVIVSQNSQESIYVGVSY